jgi:hypothetical protein
VCSDCGQAYELARWEKLARRRKAARRVRALLVAAECLANWAPPILPLLLPRAPKPARAPRPERPLIRLDGGSASIWRR